MFSGLRQLPSDRRFVPSPVYQSLVIAFVLSWLDHDIATLAGLTPAYSIVSSRFLTPRLHRSLVFGSLITSPTILPVSTGCEHQSASS